MVTPAWLRLFGFLMGFLTWASNLTSFRHGRVWRKGCEGVAIFAATNILLIL